MKNDSLDAVYGSLAHPVRRRILEVLSEREGSSTRDLGRAFQVSRWAVMKHLAILRGAGLVETLPQGRRRLHFLVRGRVTEARHWLDRLT